MTHFFQGSPFKETIRPSRPISLYITESFDGNSVSIGEAGYFKPVWSNTPTWRHVLRLPTQWTVNTIDLSKYTKRSFSFSDRST
ncbi:hypothetical protein F4813DRAFT_186239 [Daldinia decipiens]|uniref:uncharacterized protein n=1 Tax=Daldinia decipiens TaxID=326647 RepID=UPI0020C22497|nr:uncharacterized protein F4813DRAFT_186239 [Daldinia decipiens]KAI1655261.1 hypothetical protein F4813DRAFT_186239 [Daldinia decipiens]